MRLSHMLVTTWREAPSDAETLGTQMLLRAGYLRKVGSGLYANLPLMQRVLHKLEHLIRRELEGLSQEVSFPVLQPQVLWQESGRWEAYTEAEGIMFTVQDRAGRLHALGPTHEEVALDVVRGLARSYRDLPLSVYQIGRKFRDELRPRYGLLRTREFTMKDAYSFHADSEDLRQHFEAMSAAYGRILDGLGVQWRMVEADSGQIGGSGSREFMVLSGVGEDDVLFSADGLYAANAERARAQAVDAPVSPFQGWQRHHTPGLATVADACRFLGCSPAHMVKNLIYDAVFSHEGVRIRRPVMVHLRGDHQVNPVKLWNAVQARVEGQLLGLEVADPAAWAAADLPLGYLAPDLADSVIAPRDGIHPHFLRLCDEAAAQSQDFATGANQTDWHVTGANWHIQYALPEVLDLRLAQAGDPCLHDSAQTLQAARGIEVGHVFQLGTRYSQAMQATFTAADGEARPYQMGCYGIGVTRLAQAVAEQLSDAQGLCWPLSIAPFQVMLTVVNMASSAQVDVAETLYERLKAAGWEVLLDDRRQRAGAKFADADLLGIPYRLTVGRGAERGEVELKVRRSGVQQVLPLDAVEHALGELAAQG